MLRSFGQSMCWGCRKSSAETLAHKCQGPFEPDLVRTSVGKLEAYCRCVFTQRQLLFKGITEMRLRHLAHLVVLVGLLLSIAACGAPSTSSVGTAQTTTASATEASAAQPDATASEEIDAAAQAEEKTAT